MSGSRQNCWCIFSRLTFKFSYKWSLADASLELFTSTKSEVMMSTTDKVTVILVNTRDYRQTLSILVNVNISACCPKELVSSVEQAVDSLVVTQTLVLPHHKLLSTTINCCAD